MQRNFDHFPKDVQTVVPEKLLLVHIQKRKMGSLVLCLNIFLVGKQKKKKEGFVMSPTFRFYSVVIMTSATQGEGPGFESL